MSRSAPEGWNKTIEDLAHEMMRGERLVIDYDEANWARDYERSLLPPDTIFPCNNQIWVTISDCDVQVSYILSAPISASGIGKLLVNEKVRINMGSIDSKPIRVSFLPLRYEELQSILIPLDVRSNLRYSCYALHVKTVDFFKNFKLVAV